MILKKDAIVSISNQLGLAYEDFMQDWDIEMADANKLEEYISFYKKSKLNKSEKLVVMALIVASYEEFLQTNKREKIIWKKIECYLKQEFELFLPIIDYWSLWTDAESASENYFNITPLVRKVKSSSS